jgi:hypothetical protein
VRITPKVASWAILAAGVVFSLYLETLVRPDVFISGDAGVKLLLTKQLAAGDLHADLRLPAEPWVRDLWRDGLFPLSPPFAYDVDGRWYLGFPILPSLVAVPGYAALGYRGLYVLPLLALWATWLVVADLCRRLELGAAVTALVLAAVIFASPLTLYGAMFWEHTLAVALATGGLAILVTPGERSAASVVGAGVLLGLSAWLRSELLCLVVAAGMCFGGLPSRRRSLLLVAAMAAMLGALLALNFALYGRPFGVQALQVLHSGVKERLATAGNLLVELMRLLVVFFPLVVPTALLLCTTAVSPEMRRLALTVAAFVLVVPAIVPSEGGKQWGPRYLLVTVPAVAVLAGVQLRRLGDSRFRPVYAATVVAAVVWGAFVNCVDGPRGLTVDYRDRVAPALDFVSSDPTRLVAVGHQFIGQELAAAWDEKRFFLTPTGAALTRLATAAIAHGHDRFLFLADDPVPGAWRYAADGTMIELRMRTLGVRGAYVVHEATVRRVPTAVP